MGLADNNRFKRWLAAHREEYKIRKKDYNAEVKTEVLTHYGPDGKLQCAWPGCDITDLDMLSLDHINNDGARERKYAARGGGGVATYHRVRKLNYPIGYQTLCHNHQWKKELMRRRGK